MIFNRVFSISWGVSGATLSYRLRKADGSTGSFSSSGVSVLPEDSSVYLFSLFNLDSSWGVVTLEVKDENSNVSPFLLDLTNPPSPPLTLLTVVPSVSGCLVTLITTGQTFYQTSGYVFGLSGVASLLITKTGYLPFSQTLTPPYGTTLTINATMTLISIPVNPNPTLSTGYLNVYDNNAQLDSGESFSVVLFKLGTVGQSHDRSVRTVTSNSQGILIVENLLRGATYKARRGEGSWVSFVVPNSATFTLPEILGLYPREAV